jgi:hypothetical protein
MTVPHHTSFGIAPGMLGRATQCFELLGCSVVFKPDDDSRWLMVEHADCPFAFQLYETDDQGIEPLARKRQTHIAFLSADPAAVLDSVRQWAHGNGMRFLSGEWASTQLYFDLPEVFVFGVVEVMHTSVVE